MTFDATLAGMRQSHDGRMRAGRTCRTRRDAGGTTTTHLRSRRGAASPRPVAVALIAALAGASLAALASLVDPAPAQATRFAEPAAVAVRGGGHDDADGPVYTRLGAIAVLEDFRGDSAPAAGPVTLGLRAPAGFEFREGVDAVHAVFGFDITSATIDVQRDQVVVTLTVPTASGFDAIAISGLEVRVNRRPFAFGAVHRPVAGGGSAQIRGVVASGDPSGAGGTRFATLRTERTDSTSDEALSAARVLASTHARGVAPAPRTAPARPALER